MTDTNLNIRKINPLYHRLSNSVCFFMCNTNHSMASAAISDPYLNEIMKIGGNLFRDESNGLHTETLAINHAEMDAFGGLFILSKSPAMQEILGDKIPYLQNSSHIVDRFKVLHHWREVETFKNACKTRTYTQKFTEKLLLSLPIQPSHPIDFCVACENINHLTWENVKGNSLGIVRVTKDRMLRLAKCPREIWRDFLSKRALKSLELKHVDENGELGILITSLGDIRKIHWCSDRIEPSAVMMFPTPMNNYINIVLWSAGSLQALTVILSVSMEKKIQDVLNAILPAWENSLE